MNILSIDTSGEILHLGLKSGETFLENTRDMGLKHAETLTPLIRSLMEEIDLSPKALDLVVCSQGPGSFTGLRIGLATAKGISEGAGCPLVSIPTLVALAEPWRDFEGIVMPVIDAKKTAVLHPVFPEGPTPHRGHGYFPRRLSEFDRPPGTGIRRRSGGKGLKRKGAQSTLCGRGDFSICRGNPIPCVAPPRKKTPRRSRPRCAG